MTDFEVIRLEDSGFGVVIAMKTCEAPLKFISEFSGSLKFFNYQGTVLIDQLLHSGNTNERFIMAEFNGEKFIDDSFRFAFIQRRHKVRKHMCSILRNDPESIDLTLLSNVQKQLILKGLDI